MVLNDTPIAWTAWNDMQNDLKSEKITLVLAILYWFFFTEMNDSIYKHSSPPSLTWSENVSHTLKCGCGKLLHNNYLGILQTFCCSKPLFWVFNITHYTVVVIDLFMFLLSEQFAAIPITYCIYLYIFTHLNVNCIFILNCLSLSQLSQDNLVPDAPELFSCSAHWLKHLRAITFPWASQVNLRLKSESVIRFTCHGNFIYKMNQCALQFTLSTITNASSRLSSSGLKEPWLTTLRTKTAWAFFQFPQQQRSIEDNELFSKCDWVVQLIQLLAS